MSVISSLFGKSNEAIKIKTEIKKYKSGATEDQKEAIDYFIPNGNFIFNFFNVVTFGLLGVFYRLFFEKAKDAEYERVVRRLVDSKNTYLRALEKIGLDESQLQEIPPVQFEGYAKSDFTTFTVGGEYRTSKYMVAHLFFSDTQVYLYKIILDTMKNDITEYTEECFYSDIVKLSTNVDVYEYFQRKGCLKAKWKRIPYALQEFQLYVPGAHFECCTDGDISQQMQAMKFKIREKKLYN